MAQGLFGGLTSYETQSLQDILEDIEKWIKFTNETEELIKERHGQLQNCGFWNKIPYNFQCTIECTMRYFGTIKYDLTLIQDAIKKNYITEKEVKLLKTIGHKAGKMDIEYGKTYKEDLHTWSDYSNPHFRLAEEVYNNGRDYFITLIDASNAAERLEHYMEEKKIINNVVNISGNATGMQLQQGMINSMTSSNEDNVNYDQMLGILYKIIEMLEKSELKEKCNDNSEEIRKVVLESIQMIENKDEPSKIKKALLTIKELATGITENIIATPIAELIMQLFK